MPNTHVPAAAEGLPAINRHLPALVEAGGVFFLSLSVRDPAGIASTIERLIDLLDALEPDPDLEPWLGNGDDREAENEHGGDITDEPHDDGDELEPFLGWSESCNQAYDAWERAKRLVQGIDPDGTEGRPLSGVPLDFRGEGYRQTGEALRSMKRGRRSKKTYTERAQRMPDGTMLRTFRVDWEARS